MMNIATYLVIFFSLVLIIGAIMLIFQSAKKFKLTDEQLKRVKEREEEQKIKDKLD